MRHNIFQFQQCETITFWDIEVERFDQIWVYHKNEKFGKKIISCGNLDDRQLEHIKKLGKSLLYFLKYCNIIEVCRKDNNKKKFRKNKRSHYLMINTLNLFYYINNLVNRWAHLEFVIKKITRSIILQLCQCDIPFFKSIDLIINPIIYWLQWLNTCQP